MSTVPRLVILIVSSDFVEEVFGIDKYTSSPKETLTLLPKRIVLIFHAFIPLTSHSFADEAVCSARQKNTKSIRRLSLIANGHRCCARLNAD